MRSAFVTALWLCAAAIPVHGQDSTLLAYQQTLQTLRDSMVPVRGAVSQFRRDLQLAGATTVINRAVRLNQTCAALKGSLEAAKPVFHPSRAPSDGGREASRTFLEEIGTLERALDTSCLHGLSPNGPGEWSDSLKAWGPHHTTNLQRTLMAYDGAAGEFARAVGVRLAPTRTGTIP
jgi:hypothetical protein